MDKAMVHQGMNRFTLWMLALVLAACAEVQAPPEPPTALASGEDPPALPREFRAAWVASVANIDWPSKPGLPTAQQREEIITIVERAKALNLNALVVQVRPSADAMYPSALEPWSEFLTGEQGKPPSPPYDPLAVWVDEAHKRGIELHAWFNPYRARHTAAKSAPSPLHIAKSHPQVVRAYGPFLWMDPGEPFAAQRTVDVVLDVVRRYDIDGVHFDDYFYPYPEADPNRAPNGAPRDVLAGASTPARAELDFPDEPSWRAYKAKGGALTRADWRRDNVNRLMETLYASVQREKKWVKVGISPFGLGRPDRRPAGISGFSQYDKLYADVELWLQRGWLDYLAPQLYWPIDQTAQGFAPLLDTWIAENTLQRHIWPGVYTSKIDATDKSWRPAEISRQLALLRTRAGATGHIHFSMVALLQNRQGIADALTRGAYANPALVPATPWRADATLRAASGAAPGPRIAVAPHPIKPDVFALSIVSLGSLPSAAFAVWAQYGLVWQLQVWGHDAATHQLAQRTANGMLKRVVVSSVDRFGFESGRSGVAVP
jgi:uncharacterized lipoprotein YddW (UPF0748 family)